MILYKNKSLLLFLCCIFVAILNTIIIDMLSYILRKQTNLKSLLIFLFVLCLFCGCKEKTGKVKNNFSTPKGNISFSLPIKVNTEKLTTNDGLPDNTVCDIYQDKRGFIWFCTLNGLSKYDGNRFVNFKKQDDEKLSLIDNRVKSVKEDRNDHLWILTSAELYSCLDLKHDRFVDYSGNGDLYCHYRKIMFASNKDVWLWGSSDGCRRCTFKGDSFVSYKFDKKIIGSNIVNCIFELPNHKVLIATDKTLYLYDNGKLLRIKNNCNFVKITKIKGKVFLLSDHGDCYELLASLKLKQRIASSTETRISSDSGDLFIGNKWIVFAKDGGYSFDLESFLKKRLSGDLDISNGMVIKTKENVYIYNKTGCLRLVHNGKVKALQLIPKEKACYIDYERFHVVEDSNGLVWISTYGNGLFVYDWKKNETQHFTAKINTDSPMTSNCLLYVMEDRSGGIWVSSEFSGV